VNLDLSVVVPSLDESIALPALLDALRMQDGVKSEVIVVDGGSRDGTPAQAAAAGARVFTAPRGRGAQMNAGARAAAAPLLLFLHADSELTSPRQLRDAVDAIKAAIAERGVRCAGHFALQFARDAPGHEGFYRYLEAKTALNRPGTINGDQGLMLSAEYFRELGGFDERLPFLEDQRIAAKIFATGAWLTLPGRLVTSARRFEKEGPYRRYTLMSLIMGLHAAGAEEFFARAPAVYAAQGDTARVRVGDFLALTWRVLINAGWRRALTILLRAGRFTRENSWQPFFWLDVRSRGGEGPHRVLGFHDRVVRPITSNVVFDAIGAVLIAMWFLLVLPVVYGVIDARARGGRAG
jgi:rSAM/selenodomain-associated transferase 2